MKSRNAAVAATVAGSGSGSGSRRFLWFFFDFPRWRLSNKFKRYMRTDFNAIIDSQCTHTDTATLCGSMTQLLCLQLLALRCCETFHFFCQLATNVQAVNSQWATCNMQHATGRQRTFNADCRTPKFSHLVTFMLSDFQPSRKIQNPKTENRNPKTENWEITATVIFDWRPAGLAAVVVVVLQQNIFLLGFFFLAVFFSLFFSACREAKCQFALFTFKTLIFVCDLIFLIYLFSLLSCIRRAFNCRNLTCLPHLPHPPSYHVAATINRYRCHWVLIKRLFSSAFGVKVVSQKSRKLMPVPIVINISDCRFDFDFNAIDRPSQSPNGNFIDHATQRHFSVCFFDIEHEYDWLPDTARQTVRQTDMYMTVWITRYPFNWFIMSMATSDGGTWAT